MYLSDGNSQLTNNRVTISDAIKIDPFTEHFLLLCIWNLSYQWPPHYYRWPLYGQESWFALPFFAKISSGYIFLLRKIMLLMRTELQLAYKCGPSIVVRPAINDLLLCSYLCIHFLGRFWAVREQSLHVGRPDASCSTQKTMRSFFSFSA